MAYARHRAGRNWADAEDAVQQAFLGILERPQQFQSDEHVAAYLKTCVRNYFAERSRARQRFQEFTEWLVQTKFTSEDEYISHGGVRCGVDDSTADHLNALRGWLPDASLSFLQTLLDHHGDREAAARVLGISTERVRGHLAQIRRWKRDQDYKYAYLSDIFVGVKFVTVLAPRRIGHLLGRRKIHSMDFSIYLLQHQPGFPQLMERSKRTSPDNGSFLLHLAELMQVTHPVEVILYEHTVHVQRAAFVEALAPLQAIAVQCLTSVFDGNENDSQYATLIQELLNAQDILRSFGVTAEAPQTVLSRIATYTQEVAKLPPVEQS